MKILILGGGGREHAVAAAIAKSPRVTEIFCAPGNGGTAGFCKNVDIKATDLEGVLAFCQKNKPDFVVVTPDDPLAMGMVDMLEMNGFACFGPRKMAAELEASKAFAKAFMGKNNIPTADYAVFDDRNLALAYAKTCALPIVVKADGLALGKGVIICMEREEVTDAVLKLMGSSSGSTLVFEEYLEGPEVSQLCFTDGKNIAFMPSAQDHKRAFDGDMGPNTGGMGAFSPVTCYTEDMARDCFKNICLPTVKAMAEDGRVFKGVLYVSLMLTREGPKVIEYNARFGDPEAQAVLPLLESDLLEVMMACRDGSLGQLDIKWKAAASCCVVMASGGYPGDYKKGYAISGLSAAEEIATVYHAGTTVKDGEIVTCGGRVLGVTAVADTLHEAIAKSYFAVREISFEDGFYRTDIGKKDINS